MELAFPEWAMILVAGHIQLMNDGWEPGSSFMSDMIWYGNMCSDGHFYTLYAGSQAEGLAMEPELGYERPDLDVMMVYKDGWAVHLSHCVDWRYMPWQAPNGCTDDNIAHLQLCEEGCPAGYCRVNVNGSPKELIGRLAKASDYYEPNVPTAVLGSSRAADCLLEREDTVWLSSSKTVETFRNFLSVTKEDISGPASHLDNGNTELIVTLMCHGPLPPIRYFQSRPRQSSWPRRASIDRIQKAPGMLVCASHTLSSDDQQALQFRFSFSLQELMLVKDMPGWVKQGYTAFKLTVKSLLKHHRHCLTSEGRSKVCSYHLKTVLLWTLEDPDSWNMYCPFVFMMRLLTSLQSFIRRSPPVLPNYFIPECNLFESTDRLDIDLLLKAVKQIKADPFKSILDAPSSPGLLYGEGPVDREHEDRQRLVASLRGFYIEGIGASKEQLQECVHMLERSNPHRRPFRWLLAGCLLSRVESYRRLLWVAYRRRDIANEDILHRVYWRPPPRRLMAILFGLKQHIYYWGHRSRTQIDMRQSFYLKCGYIIASRCILQDTHIYPCQIYPGPL